MQNQNALPILHSLETVAVLLGRSYKTLLTCRTRHPHLVPRVIKIGNRLLVTDSDLHDFINGKREPVAPRVIENKGRGRPSVKETMKAEAAGMTVAQARAARGVA